jgi:hypothetical protein
MLKPIAFATLVAGTLDILFAIALTLFHGREPANMLRFVASGPFPSATNMGTAGAILGLIVHFALMAVMATAFVLVVRGKPQMLRQPVLVGIVFGVATYVVMNLLVLPLRFPAAYPPRLMSVATQMFAHVVLVGLPFALIARAFYGTRSVSAELARG